MKTATNHRLPEGLERVHRRREFVLQPWMMLVLFALAITLFIIVAVPLGKRAWNSTFNLPEVRRDPFGQVVEVREADGVAYTRDNDPNFDQRVARILKSPYDTVNVGLR